MPELWRAAGHRSMPWKNGGGTTREVALGPAGSTVTDFDWRISFAEVVTGGPFSSFDDIDRVIILVEGEEMLLTVDGTDRPLARFEPFSFDGESIVDCRIPGGPTTDLNVMTRRGRVTARVWVHGSGRYIAAGGLILVVVQRSITVDDTLTLNRFDAARWTGPVDLALTGTGIVAAIELTAAGSSSG